MTDNLPVPLHQIEVVAPNLNRRLSGVTSTIVRLVPRQAASIGIVAFGVGLPDSLPQLTLMQLLKLGALSPARGGSRVWHARRNVEMLLGVCLKTFLRHRYKLLFTSASQREHSWWTRFLIRRMDQVIATSDAGKAYLKVPASVVYHGIDVEGFAPAPEKASLKKELNLPDGHLIGCIGRIRHQKGTDVFVDAMLAALPELPGWYAVVLGRATASHKRYLEALKEKVASAGMSDRILFRDEVPTTQVSVWYQSLSLFVAPQRWEGFGLTPLESMACEVPVVATTVGAFPELIVAQETGFLVTPGDAKEMANKVVLIGKDEQLRARMAVASRNRAVEQFDLTVEANRLNEIYRQLNGASAS